MTKKPVGDDPFPNLGRRSLFGPAELADAPVPVLAPAKAVLEIAERAAKPLSKPRQKKAPQPDGAAAEFNRADYHKNYQKSYMKDYMRDYRRRQKEAKK